MTRRLMLVHAHPDDESILTGATIAHYLTEGAEVAVVTCTRGEEGEIIPPALATLDSGHDDGLGDYRAGELAAALAALGGPEHHFLAGGRWRDSGMAGTPTVERADCFWRADLLDASLPLTALIRSFRPHVLVLEDPSGGYRHPDHVRSHQVGTYAAALAAAPTFETGVSAASGPGNPPTVASGEATASVAAAAQTPGRPAAPTVRGGPEHAPWSVCKVYWMAVPRSAVAAGLADVAGAISGGAQTAGHARLVVPAVDDLARVVDDALVTTVVDGREHVAAKRAAMAAHRTQITVATPEVFALSNNLAQPLLGREYFRLAAGVLGPVGSDGLETNLFAGLEDVIEREAHRAASEPAPRSAARALAPTPGRTPGRGPTVDPGPA